MKGLSPMGEIYRNESNSVSDFESGEEDYENEEFNKIWN
jgi:hypothetical protein